jgi:DNA uptake protein ComE-like DNA-binding protein
MEVRQGLGLVSRPTAIDPSPPHLVIDPNTAPREVLLALPRLGPALVDRIEAERRKAPFESAEDLDRRVKGIGPAIMGAIGPHLDFGPDSAP